MKTATSDLALGLVFLAFALALIVAVRAPGAPRAHCHDGTCHTHTGVK